MANGDTPAGLVEASGESGSGWSPDPYFTEVAIDTTNPSDVVAPDDAWNFSGAMRDLGGFGEQVSNAWKNLSNGFLSGITGGADTRSSGGAYGAAGPGIRGRFTFPWSSNVQGTSMMQSLLVAMAIGLGVWFLIGRLGR